MFGRKVGMLATLVSLLGTPLVAQQTPEPPGKVDHVAAVKQSLQASLAALHEYQWVETTVVSIKGEEKSHAQKRCQYSADGEVLKTPLSSEDEGWSPRGIRGIIAEHKKEEITASIEEAMALVKEYVPPDPARIEAAKKAGKVTMGAPDANGLVHVVIKDYLKSGDSLAIDLNVATDHLSGMAVSTFTDGDRDPVALTVSMGTFFDGTTYPAVVHLDVAAQHLSVAIENSRYTKLGD